MNGSLRDRESKSGSSNIRGRNIRRVEEFFLHNASPMPYDSSKNKHHSSNFFPISVQKRRKLSKAFASSVAEQRSSLHRGFAVFR